jgi:hypothetical protein
MRLNVRRVLVETGYKFFKHAAQNDWKEKLVHRSELVEDKGDGNWQIEEIRYDVKPKFYLDIARRIAHFLKIFP